MYTAGLILLLLLLFIYCGLILQYRQWFLRLHVFKTRIEVHPHHFFSIIIPARNESDCIEGCLHAILQQDYPAHLYEIIVINDHSTDDTEEKVMALQAHHPQIKLINLAAYPHFQHINSYKKKALEMAIGESSGEWIVTTDADCVSPNNWLRILDQYIQQSGKVFVAAPVMFTHRGGFLSLFQLLDFLSLQGITAAAVSAGYHTMCNGANLAYRKDVFASVNGFQGIDDLASGDDMLLMYKIKQQYPEGLGYLFHPDAIVSTEPMSGWKTFINQRIRWASKAERYQDKQVFRILLLVYLLNAALFIWLPLSWWMTGNILQWIGLVLIKTLIELGFMIPVSRFYGKSNTLIYFPFMQPMHIVYTVVAGWLGKFGTYQWKGRIVR